jgi:hypothetical protein
MTQKGSQSTVHKWGGLVLALGGLATAACGFETGITDQQEVREQAENITGGWTALTPINGWQSWGTGYEPAVGMVDGIVTFKGALKATNPTSDTPFTLPADFLPSPKSNVVVPIALSKPANQSGKYGALFVGVDGIVHISQDSYVLNQANPVVGPSAKSFTSLDGASYDREAGTLLTTVPDGWDETYATRIPPGSDTHPPAIIKNVGGFVRFQGGLSWADDGYGGLVCNIPNTSTLGWDARPTNTVWTATHLGGLGSTGSWGLLSIYPTGDVFINGNFNASNINTSLEGVFYSKTLTGNVTLPLATGWSAFSARSVRVGKYGDVVRFQGAIKGDSTATTTIANLAATYRPSRKIFVVAGANNVPLPARIIINTDGKVEVDDPGLAYAKTFLTLDGVSFAL